jgi:hypothetical protein
MTTIEQIAKKFEIPLEEVKKINNDFAMCLYHNYIERGFMYLPDFEVEPRAMALTYDYIEKWGVQN